jgi:hypothetical protein
MAAVLRTSTSHNAEEQLHAAMQSGAQAQYNCLQEAFPTTPTL